jgi:hypothetical protein
MIISSTNIMSREGVWLKTGFGLVIGFTGLLQIRDYSNYNRFTNLHTLHFPRAQA